MKFVKLERT